MRISLVKTLIKAARPSDPRPGQAADNTACPPLSGLESIRQGCDAGRRTAGASGDEAGLSSSADQHEDDALLVCRLQRGDSRALDALMRRHGRRLRAIAHRMLGRLDEAEDLVQDTFVTLWRQADRIEDGRGPIGAWLTRVLVNRAIDRARRNRFLQFIGLDSAEESADEAPNPETATVSRSEMAAVKADLARLPARQRAAILLAADGHGTAEIAAAMDLSVGAAEQLLVRARRALRLAATRRETGQGGAPNGDRRENDGKGPGQPWKP